MTDVFTNPFRKQSIFMSRLATLMITLMMASGHATASSFDSDGMPCLENLCVGDDMLRLERVDWQAAVNPANGLPLANSRISDKYAQGLKRILRGTDAAVRAVAPYWLLRRFDRNGLRALAGVRAVCDLPRFSQRLRADFTDSQGHRVVIHFAPTASADGKTQRFLVTMIRRHFSEISQPWQLKAMAEQLGASYQGFGTFASETKPGVVWNPHASRGPTLTLLAPFGDSSEEAERLRMHPDCAAAVQLPEKGPQQHAINPRP